MRDWLHNGWLIEHRSGPGEIRDLLAVIDRDLRDCRNEGLSADWRLAIAYNAALQAAIAALAAEGYRATRGAHHFRAIQSLTHTLAWDADSVRLLDRFRKKRNLGEYERAGTTTEQEAKEMLALAEELHTRLRDWLRLHHPEMVSSL
ncbi:MAG: hypothetical protein HYV26_22780 [Candidatus Hydrogenedentes bacterium]|nr:hypothetical protein [Candidatus Hydrogenedentota bacterium]